MACPGCQNCNGSPVKDSLPLPVAIICDLSTGAANCPNPDVSVLNVCDSTGAPFLEVILSCNGTPQTTPTYLNFDLTPATPVLPVTSCESAFSVSTETACIRLIADDSIVDNVEIVKVIDTTTGAIATLRVFSLDGVTEYTLPLPPTQRLGSCELSYQTFEINEVCADGAKAFRVEQKQLDGSSTIVFYGTNGTILTPVTWIPGSCAGNAPNSISMVQVCANGGTPAFRRETIDDADVSTVTFLGLNGAPFVPVSWFAGECPENFTDALDDQLVCADGLPAFRHETLDENGVSTVVFIGTNGTLVTPVTWTPGSCTDCVNYTETIVCAAGVQLIRRIDCQGIVTFIGSNGITVPTPVAYTIGQCSYTIPTTDSLSVETVCADGNQAFRRETLDENGVSTVTFLSTNGAVIVPTTWEPGNCSDCDSFTESIVCASGVQLIKRTNNCTGVNTFIGSDGIVVPTPLTYTIGECVSVSAVVHVAETATLVCADGSPATRKEILFSDNTTTVVFLGTDDTIIVPTTWFPGECLENLTDSVVISEVCADGSPAFRKEVTTENGVITVTFLGVNGATIVPITWTPGDCLTGVVPVSETLSLICADGAPAFRKEILFSDSSSTVTFLSTDGSLIVPTTWIPGECLENLTDSVVISEVCADGVPAFRKEVTTEAGVTTVTFLGTNGAVIVPTTWTPGDCAECLNYTETIVCASGVQLIRRVDCENTVTFIGSDGVTVATPATYTIGDCDVKLIEACDTLTPVTVCIPFFMEVANDNTPTGNNFFIDPVDNTWKPYTIQGTVSTGACKCDANDVYTYQTICLQDSNNIQFIRVFKINAITSVATLIGDYLQDFSSSYSPVGSTVACNDTTYDTEVVTLCDNNGAFLRNVVYNELGNVDTVYDTTVDGITPYTAVGTVGNCSGNDIESVQLCFTANTAGVGYAIGDQIIDVRWFNTATNTQVGEVAFNVTQGGSAVTTPLTAANFDECATNSIDREFEVLCDTVGSFLRRYSVSSTGVVTVTDTTLNGTTAYVPVGAVGTCNPTVADREFWVLCDTVGSFLRRYSVTSAGVVTILDTTLDGTTAYVPVGAIGVCKIDTNPVINSTLVRQTGAGVQTIAVGARSITVTVLAGNPTVSIGGGPAVTLVPGLSMTWDIDYGGKNGETLAQAFTFTGNATSDFYVHTIRE